MPAPINILADASLPGLSALFTAPFNLTLYESQQHIPKLLTNQDVLLCRSTLRVSEKLLAQSTLQCVATASSGTDHIDSEYLKLRQMTLFDAKGSNARAVADYVVANLAALHQLNKPIGNVAGVIGVGEVGSRVVMRLTALGFDVIRFDPIKALQDKLHYYGSLADLTACDVLCIHPSLHESEPYPSKNLLNAEFFAQLKSNVIIINASRGGVINEEALLATTKPIIYCTDVYCNEPLVNPNIIDFSTLCTPHIAGHSIEAKQTAVIQVSQQLHLHYGLPMPSFSLALVEDNIAASPRETWQDCVLSLYNPQIDTAILKAAIDKKDAFLTQRQAHQYRHDFNCYAMGGIGQQTKLVLGY